MSSLIFGTRGAYHMSELFKTFAQAQMFTWKRKNLNVCECGQEKKGHKKGKKYIKMISKDFVKFISKDEKILCRRCIKKELVCNKFKPREELTSVQASLRPIQLWEYVFPDESMADVFSALGLTAEDGKPEATKHWPLSKTKMWALRKALKCEPIPDVKWQRPQRFIMHTGISLYPIGIRRDERGEMSAPGEGHWQQELI